MFFNNAKPKTRTSKINISISKVNLKKIGEVTYCTVYIHTYVHTTKFLEKKFYLVQ